MRIPPLEQLADEAIVARHAWIEHRLPSGVHTDVLQMLRMGELAAWAGTFPALDALAEWRQEGLAQLPAPESTGTAGAAGAFSAVARGVHLAAVQQERPVEHTYLVYRLDGDEQDREPIGWAWLSSGWDGAGPGRYALRLRDQPGSVAGDELGEALHRAAALLARGGAR